jgi:hypothetical protein
LPCAGWLLLPGCAAQGNESSISAAPQRIYIFNSPSEDELATITHPDLRSALLDMAEKDQDARMKIGQGDEKQQQAAVARVAAVDRAHGEDMKEFVDAYGWPTIDMVARDGTRAAWLLVQHADHDVAFQRHCLEHMQKLVDTQQVFAGDVAYLTDRVKVNEGKPQVFGTQFHTVGNQLVPRKMIDPPNVDKRRASMGLGTLEEYRKQMLM